MGLDKRHEAFKEYLYGVAEEETRHILGFKLNLGCGSWLRPPEDDWINLDKYPTSDLVYQWDVETGTLPFPDDYFSCVLAIDFLEHLPHRSPAQEEVGELFSQVIVDLIRCSKHGARWLVMTPSQAQSLEACGHCRVVTPTTFRAYSEPRSSGESRGQLSQGILLVTRVQHYRTWHINKFLGRSIENIIWLRVVKHG
jgi:hypothetical protein